MNQKNLLKKSALAVAVALVSSNLYAAGFQLNEYTAAGLGRSFSGEGAIADSASWANCGLANIFRFASVWAAKAS